MDEHNQPQAEHPGEPFVWVQPPDPQEPQRRRLLRRLRILLLTGGVAFALTTWMLVRVENVAAVLGLGPGPASVARAHLEALNRGALREAYELFSTEYRQQVTFEMFHELVVTHRNVFRTQSAQFDAGESSGDFAVIDSHLIARDGERYVARFTLVRLEGRWWINDLRWGLDHETENLIQA